MPRQPLFFRNQLIRMKFDTHYSLSDIAKAIINGPYNQNLDPSRWVKTVGVASTIASLGGAVTGSTTTSAQKRSAVFLLKGRGGSWAIEQVACMYAEFLDPDAVDGLVAVLTIAGANARAFEDLPPDPAWDRRARVAEKLPPAPAWGRNAEGEDLPPAPTWEGAARRAGAPSHTGYVKPKDFVDTFTGQPTPFFAPDEVLDPATGRRLSFNDPALLATFTAAERSALEALDSEIVAQIVGARDVSPIAVVSARLMAGLKGAASAPFHNPAQPAQPARAPVRLTSDASFLDPLPGLTAVETLRQRNIDKPEYLALAAERDAAIAAKKAAGQPKVAPTPSSPPQPMPPRPRSLRDLPRRPVEPQEDLDLSDQEREDLRLEAEAEEERMVAERARLAAPAAAPENAAVVPEGYYGFVELPEELRGPSAPE